MGWILKNFAPCSHLWTFTHQHIILVWHFREHIVNFVQIILRLFEQLFKYVEKLAPCVSSIYLSGFLTAVAVFRKPNAIPLFISIDLVINFLLSCTPSIHVFLGRPIFLLSRGIQSITNFGILSSGILLMWPYHCSLLCSMISPCVSYQWFLGLQLIRKITTPHNRIHLKKPADVQLTQKFRTFYSTRRLKTTPPLIPILSQTNQVYSLQSYV